MGNIVGKLNLNKTPQLVENNSLIFAKNIKLLKDGTIGRDTGLEKLSIDSGVLYDNTIQLKEEYRAKYDYYSDLCNNYQIDTVENVEDAAEQLIEYASIKPFREVQYVELGIDLPNTNNAEFSRANYNLVFQLSLNNHTKYPVFSQDFFDKVAESVNLSSYNNFNYTAYLAAVNQIKADDIDFYNSHFFEYTSYEIIEQGTPNTYSSMCAYVLNRFIHEHGTAVNTLLDTVVVFHSLSDSNKKFYEEEKSKYEKLVNDYTSLASIYVDRDITALLGYISYNTRFYLFVQFDDLEVPDSTAYGIIYYDEKENTIYPVNCNWTWHGGELDGYAITNLNGDILLNVAEYLDDDNLVPFKSINTSYSSIDDDESIYTQTPIVPLVNLNHIGYQTTSIPNGVYQFFIRYKIRDNHYTNWYPASKELFAGVRETKKTNQGGLSYINLDHDSGRSFVFEVETVSDYEIPYKTFQIGFIISHDDEVYARSWKEFDISTTKIDFDYDQNYIKEIDIKDLTNTVFQLYNVKNITSFKNKLYVSNYRETDFNPELQHYADNVLVEVNRQHIDFTVQSINKFPIVYKSGSTKIIEQINNKTIDSICKSLLRKASNFITGDSKETTFELVSPEGIKLKLEKKKTPHYNNYEAYPSGGTNYLWAIDVLTDWYNPTTGFMNSNTDCAIRDAGGKNQLGYPLHLTAEDVGKFIYQTYQYDSSDTHKGFEKALMDGTTWWHESGGAHPKRASYRDMYGALGFDTNIESLVSAIFDNITVELHIDKPRQLEEHGLLIDYRFWYCKKFKKRKSLPSSIIDNLNSRVYEYDPDRSTDAWDYDADMYEFKYEFTFVREYLDKFDNTNIDSATTENIEYLDNKTTLIPYQEYKFFIHYINKNGEITNGYQIGQTSIKVEDSPPEYIIYPSFSNIRYPYGYVGCFISIQHFRNKTGTICNIESLASVGTIGDCLDLDTRLISPVTKLPIYYNNAKLGVGDYYMSGDSTYLQLFGASGKIKLESIADTYTYCYIVLDYTNDSESIQLIKCTPFITSDSYDEYDKMNLLGHLNLVKKVNTNSGRYYADTNVYDKTIDQTSLVLHAVDNSAEWGEYIDTDYVLVYSNYNLNFMSLSLDVIPKVKTIDDEHSADGTAAIISINSIVLSDIYELKSMYHSYTRKYFSKYNNDSVVKFNNTIRSTVLEGDESVVPIYRFDSGDYYNVPTDKGQITNLVSVGEAILVHTQDSLFKFVGSNSLTATGGENVALKENQPFESGIQELFGSRFGYAGLANKHDSIVTQAGYFFYDKDANIIYGYSDGSKLGELSSPIEKLINFGYIENVDFASDFYNDRLFVNIKFGNGEFVTLTYNLKVNSFVSLHDFDYDRTINTKVNCYFVKDLAIYKLSSDEVGYKELAKNDVLFPYNDLVVADGIKSVIIDVIFNDTYQQVKVLEAIQWICKAVTRYGSKWKETIMHHGPNRYFAYRPLMAEEYNGFYSGDKLRIYSDCCCTPLSDIRTRSNDFALYTDSNGEELDENERLQEELPPRITSTNSYKYPRFNLGSYSFNYFRNTYTFNEDGDIQETYPMTDNGVRTQLGDDQSILYGRYFVARFILDPRVNFKLENILFITTAYNKIK